MTKNTEIAIDRNKCVKCGLCSKICSAKVITLAEGNSPQVLEESIGNCLKCQHCFAICPTGAIRFDGTNPEDVNKIGKIPTADSLLNLIQTRKSCRHYKNENVSKEIISKLKDMTAWVPTGCNSHKLCFSFIEDKDDMNKFRAELTKEFSKLSAKLRVVAGLMKQKGVISNLKRFAKYQNTFKDGEDVIFRNAPHMVVVSVAEDSPCGDIDTTIALSYLELYAQTLGLGTLWCGMAKWCFDSSPELCKLLKIPKKYKLGYVMLFGYPDEKFIRITNPEPCKIKTIKF